MQSSISVPKDGAIRFEWSAAEAAESVSLLLIRTGAVPGFLRMRLGREVGAYQVERLSRHQRYLCAIATHAGATMQISPWRSVTPRLGVDAAIDTEKKGVEADIAKLSALRVMPQNRRLTVFWSLGKGFIDDVELSVLSTLGGERLLTMRVEPEVKSVVIDATRCPALANGEAYLVSVVPRFGTSFGAVISTQVVPAPQGEERARNRALPQAGIVYPFLALGDEHDPFAAETPRATPVQRITCCHCRAQVAWVDYRLRCGGCGAEFIPNGRGDFLDLARLRFGTCACCLPKKVLVQEQGSDALVCAHSQKEHLRLAGERGFRLIEDLPFGLCQCCRPRRPLERRGDRVVCGKTKEPHRASDGHGYVLVPTAPVFDAAAIDDLLDQGLAAISASGISRAR